MIIEIDTDFYFCPRCKKLIADELGRAFVTNDIEPDFDKIKNEICNECNESFMNYVLNKIKQQL